MTGVIQQNIPGTEGYEEGDDLQPSNVEGELSTEQGQMASRSATKMETDVHAPSAEDLISAKRREIQSAEQNEKVATDHALVTSQPSDDRALAPTNLVIPPIPRISAHAFCLMPDTAELIQSAKDDRRLAKAQISIEMGGVRQAIKHFSEAPTPNLIIVEMEANSESLFTHLNNLADVCDPGTKVIVVGDCNDIRIYRALIQEGVSEYLVAPFTSIQLIEAIGNLYEDPEAAPVGRVMAFVGSKGGAGSSTIAHNTAWVLANQFKEEVTIVDLDLAYGTACLNFNQDPTNGLADALSAPERLDDVLLERMLIHCGKNINILSAPSSLDRNYATSAAAFESVLDTVRKNTPNVIVDLPHAWSEWSKTVLLSADQIAIVAIPELASLRNTMNLFEVFKQARPNDPLPNLILNKTGLAKKIEITERDFSEALHQEPSVVLPFDAELFGRASNNGQMIGEIDKRGELTAKFSHLTSVLTGRDIPQPSKSSVLDLLSFSKAAKREKRSA